MALKNIVVDWWAKNIHSIEFIFIFHLLQRYEKIKYFIAFRDHTTSKVHMHNLTTIPPSNLKQNETTTLGQ